MKVIELSINTVKPYWRNPRDNDAAVEAVKKSIADYGMNQPIVLDAENVIIAGHTRYKACMQLGMKKVPCVVLDISPEKAKEYRIADNKTGEMASWDMALLIPELREIEGLAEFQAYFPTLDIVGLLAEAAGMKAAPVTAKSIEQVKASLDGAQQNKGVDYIEATCTHCGETIYLDRDSLARQPTSNFKEGD